MMMSTTITYQTNVRRVKLTNEHLSWLQESLKVVLKVHVSQTQFRNKKKDISYFVIMQQHFKSMKIVIFFPFFLGSGVCFLLGIWIRFWVRTVFCCHFHKRIFSSITESLKRLIWIQQQSSRSFWWNKLVSDTRLKLYFSPIRFKRKCISWIRGSKINCCNK